jgi:hypothetical protein
MLGVFLGATSSLSRWRSGSSGNGCGRTGRELGVPESEFHRGTAQAATVERRGTTVEPAATVEPATVEPPHRGTTNRGNRGTTVEHPGFRWDAGT